MPRSAPASETVAADASCSPSRAHRRGRLGMAALPHGHDPPVGVLGADARRAGVRKCRVADRSASRLRVVAQLVWVGFLGVFFVLIASKTFSAPAWFLAVLVGALLTEAVHPAKRAAPSAVAKLPLDQVRPWSGSGVTAAVTERPFGQPHAKPAVLVTTQDGAPSSS